MDATMNIPAIRSERLRDLRTSRGMSTKELAKAIGVAPGSINNWENDDESVGKVSTDGMSLINLVKLADFFDVSLDYLAGRTDVKSPSPTLQGVCAYTGLTEKVVEKLNTHVERIKTAHPLAFGSKRMLESLNLFLACKSSMMLFALLSSYIQAKGKAEQQRRRDYLITPSAFLMASSKRFRDLGEKGYQLLTPDDAVDYAYFQASDQFADILKDELGEEEESDDGEH